MEEGHKEIDVKVSGTLLSVNLLQEEVA